MDNMSSRNSRSEGSEVLAETFAGLRGEILSENEFTEIAKLISEPNVWKKVARQLGIEQRHLLCIDEKEKECEEKAYQMLLKWKQQYPHQCTRGKLCSVLRKEGFNDKAKKLLKVPVIPESHTDLQEKLKKFYKDATLPGLPWLEEGSELALKEFYSQLQLSSTKENISIEDIFKSFNGPLKRLLIEGQPGYGKTTLMTKLAYDWAVGKDYIREFHYVFLIRLKEIGEKDVQSAIQDIATFWRLSAPTNFKKVLILLDGLDEVPEGISRQSALDVLYSRSFHDATVVVTCRNGMFESRKEDQITPKCSASRTIEFWDKKIDVIGLTKDGVKKLLGKLLSDEQAKELFDKLKTDSSVFGEICKSPLIVTLLGYLYANGNLVEFQTTTTKLYTNVLNGLAKFSFERRNEKVGEDFNLFSRQSKSFLLWKEKLTQFGKICFQLIKESFELQLNDSGLMREMYSLGFLSKTESKGPFKKITSFEPFHRSFAEYFAAFYASQQYLSSEVDQKIVDEITHDLQAIYWKSSGTSLILPFIAGIMGSKVNELFAKLSPHAHIYGRLEENFWKIVEECEQSDNVCDSIIQLLPETIDYDFSDKINPRFLSSDFFKRLIEEWMKQCNSSCLIFDAEHTDHLPPLRGHVNTIVFYVYDIPSGENFEHCSLALNEMSCSLLVFLFYFSKFQSFENTSEERKMLDKWLSLKTKINADQLYLVNCDSSVCDLLMSNSELSRGENLISLHCVLEDDGNWNSLVNNLLVNSQIHFLELDFKNNMSEDVLAIILDNISKSPSCAAFDLKNSGEMATIDLSLLYKCSDKTFNVASFNNFNVVNNDPKQKEIKVNSLQISNCKIDPEIFAVVLNSDISSLICDSDFILRLTDVFPNDNHPFYKSLMELYLLLDYIPLNEESWRYVTNFKNVKTLLLRADHSAINSLNCATDHLQSMELLTLRFLFNINDCDQKKCVTDISSLLKQLKGNEYSNPVISVVLQIEEPFNEDVKEEINELLNLLNEGLVNEIIFDELEDPISSNHICWINVNNFEIKYTKLNNASYWRYYSTLSSKEYFQSNHYTITKRQPQLCDISGPSQEQNGSG